MIQEDYVSFELAKLLKEKGFNAMCEHYFSEKLDGSISCHTAVGHWNAIMNFIARPSLSLAMKWLRGVHNIIIVIEPHSYNHTEEKTSSYDFSMWCGDNYEHPLTTNYPTYEEAIEAALKYVLEKFEITQPKRAH